MTDFDDKTCFIITPIGQENSEIRRKANGLIDSVIAPALKNLGFKEKNINIPHRTYAPGSITSQVIQSIFESDIVVANLTGLNPNVMYELAVRHATKKPVVSLKEQEDAKLPFDIDDERTIFYSDDMYDVSNIKPKLKKMIKNSIEEEAKDNPIYRSLEVSSILEDVQEGSFENFIMDKLRNIENQLKYQPPPEITRETKISSDITRVSLDEESKIIDNGGLAGLDSGQLSVNNPNELSVNNPNLELDNDEENEKSDEE